MSEVTIRIDTTDALRKLQAKHENFEELPTLVENVSDEMSERVVDVAKMNCPIGETGKLQDSIRVQGEYPSYEFIADAKNSQGTSYAVFVEYGTSRQEPQPFIEPAIDEAVSDYRMIIRDEIKRLLGGR